MTDGLAAVPGAITVTPPADDAEVAAIVAAIGLLLRQPEPSRAAPERSGWRFAGRWWR